jgi:predicted  nucleic acid-binding Zn-ribbon protein
VITAALGITTAAIIFLIGAPPRIDGVRNLIEGAAAAIAVIGGSLGLWRFRRLSSAQREDLEASAAQRAVEAMKAVLDQYVRELQKAKTSITGLEKDLAKASERIMRLEEQLDHVTDERDRLAEQSRAVREQLQERLDAALEDRGRIQRELEDVRVQVEDLQHRVGRRRSTDPPRPADPE